LRANLNILILVTAIMAFLPVLGVGYFVDGLVRNREVMQIEDAINDIAEEARSAVFESITMMEGALAESNSVCTPKFLNNLRKKMMSGIYVREVLVESNQGAPYCDALGAPSMNIEVISDELSIPGRTETIAAVMMAGSEVPMFRVSQNIGANKRISAFVNFSQMLEPSRLPFDIRGGSMLRISFTDNTDLLAIGDPDKFEAAARGGKYIVANAFAGEVPVLIEIGMPFAAVRAPYGDLYLTLTLIASLIGGGILILMLRLARRSQIPSFDLEHAITDGSICPYYQPVIDLSTGRISGCEVLARWVKPNGKTISPAAFIEYAELTGLAIPMTIKLMETVKSDLSELSENQPGLKISINLFEGHFRDGTIIEDVQAIFGDSAICYRQLVFEITERFPLEDSEQTSSVINGLHALGCKLAMDDVGTGHSNLSFVQTLGVDIIKIDRVFVSAIEKDTTSAPVLDGLISMAQNLGSGIVAEGVETQEQAMYLRAKGVSQIQGFLFAPALPAKKFVQMAEALNAEPETDDSGEQQAA
jgi:sensor c-di-GMP phosphodiesterase-like protein